MASSGKSRLKAAGILFCSALAILPAPTAAFEKSRDRARNVLIFSLIPGTFHDKPK
jgi:ABC-type Mn2+/Zn2+ transport system permease subunit